MASQLFYSQSLCHVVEGELPTAEYIRDRIVDVFLARDESRPPQSSRSI
ncbi:MAG: hypothetical protein V7754_22415 [Halioglobus sp.]